jgi:hypothetical protein
MSITAAISMIDLGDKAINLFRTVKVKLVNQPEIANGKLEAVFEELSKIFLAFDMEITNFLSLTFDNETNLKEERKLLYKLEGIELSYRLNEARGHCGKIKNIYDKYLDKWLSKVLSPDESGDMMTLFENLENADQGMLNSIYEIGNSLNSKAKEILILLDNNKLDEINKLMTEFRKEMLPIRAKLSKTTSELHLLANEFTDSSGAV